jgi:triosephosphate isomerase (TIM)
LEWIGQVGSKLQTREDIKVVVCPTFTALEEVKTTVQTGGLPLLVGCQDLSPFDEGAYTGEEAASILKQFVEVAILGHSERRKNFGETDEMVSQKVKQALDHQIIPVVCVQDENTPIPEGCKVVAYEPVFAIGTGMPDTPDNANKVAGEILEKHPGIEILYGGSVNSENAKSFTDMENISGLLIGKASLVPEEFVKIVNTVA